MKRYFFDAHMHAMNLLHPSFVSFVESVADNVGEFITSGALSPGYLLTPANRGQQGFITLLNMFTIFERSIGEIFGIMEKDLEGTFTSVQDKPSENVIYPPKPYIRNKKFYFRDKAYDSYALIPLVMDFSRTDDEQQGRSYYSVGQQNKILSYIEDTLAGIQEYRSNQPKGLLEFFPFLGINPEAHELSFVKELLHTHLVADHIFKGVKLYPPLGTNPWPEDEDELKKMRFVYEFCLEHDLGIITHCDDQGFRAVSPKLAQQYTNPASWKPVFAEYPLLRVDFAHYGRQYSPIGKSPLHLLLDRPFTTDPWFVALMELIGTYEHIYADFSFSGTRAEFYEQLHTYLNQLEDQQLAEKIRHRSMFGSDFSVNLAKVESYSNYLRIFETSPFSDEEIDLFASQNPMRFLGL
ncbi:MAG: amidohydrolase family protein [Sphaerochaetaceae bacterium]|jgi:predicted TIM-barrel fold metal-dependent hydrolase